MPEWPEGLLLALDTASDVAGVALMEGESLLGQVTWHARQSHSRQLLPAADWLLAQVSREKHDISAIAVCLGPGSYAGMRVGVSTAKALSYGLGARLVGVGRLAAEALPLVVATAGRVVPLQAAGRAELAWAVYGPGEGDIVEQTAPRLSDAATLLSQLHPGDVVTGDIERLDGDTRAALAARDCRLAPPPASRVSAVATLGLKRLQRGEQDDADSLAPMYLRAPAIGLQPPR